MMNEEQKMIAREQIEFVRDAVEFDFYGTSEDEDQITKLEYLLIMNDGFVNKLTVKKEPLFVNEVRSAFRLKKKRAGQFIGWKPNIERPDGFMLFKYKELPDGSGYHIRMITDGVVINELD